MGVAAVRKQQHDRIVNKLAVHIATGAWPGKEPTGVQHVHEYEARNGGAGAWVDLPVCILPAGYHNAELNRAERL